MLAILVADALVVPWKRRTLVPVPDGCLSLGAFTGLHFPGVAATGGSAAGAGTEDPLAAEDPPAAEEPPAAGMGACFATGTTGALTAGIGAAWAAGVAGFATVSGSVSDGATALPLRLSKES